MSRHAILCWSALGSLDPVVRLSGAPEAALRAEMAQFPGGIRGIVVTDGGAPVMSAVLVDRLRETQGTRTFARTFLAPDVEIEPLHRFLEDRSRADGIRLLRFSLAGAAGFGKRLASCGYEPVESYVQMRQAGPARAAGPLPPGIREVRLQDVPLEAYLSMSNEAFAAVPGAVALTEHEWELATQNPRYDEQLVRVLIDDDGPVGFLRGMKAHADSAPEVEVIGLLPRGRGRGLGRWLLRRCEELLRASGAEVIELLVASTNTSAVSLYVAEGYVERWRRETYARTFDAR